MKRGDIYYTNIEGHGSVQPGCRPVIIVQNDIGNQFSPTTIVCNITTAKKRPLPTHVEIGTNGGLHQESMILCEQIQTVSKTDLETYVGSISEPKIIEELNEKIQISLGIKKLLE